MKEKLKQSSLRYAALAGVLAPSETSDRQTAVGSGMDFCSHPGTGARPLGRERGWTDDEAIAFVQDSTGYNTSLCRMWLVYEWDIDVPATAGAVSTGRTPNEALLQSPKLTDSPHSWQTNANISENSGAR